MTRTEVRTFDLNRETKRATQVLPLGSHDKLLVACGSVQKANDNDALYVIGWGWATTDNGCTSVIDASTARG